MSAPTHLQKLRQQYKPIIPNALSHIKSLKARYAEEATESSPSVEKFFPNTFKQKNILFATQEQGEQKALRVGVVLSGGQAAGGHNVITGIYDAMKQLHTDSRLFGFLNGPAGIVSNKHLEITGEFLEQYRNQGGFDMIGSGRDKIETEEQFTQAANTAVELELDGLVIIGGDDSNTNAALLAEYFLGKGIKTRVVGAPKTIDGDLKNEDIEISFGFDTATKTFSETIGNILRDCLSAKKYYYFIKLMGRSASHITLECALQTHPNLALIGEEIAKEKKTLRNLTKQMSDIVLARAAQGKHYGVFLIPEGIIEFIPEFSDLIGELNKMKIDPEKPQEERIAAARSELSKAAKECFDSIPKDIQAQLLLERDPHGNVQVSKIETERLFIEAVKGELKIREKEGLFDGKFSAQPHFCGYEGRSCFPSNFDCQYCYALGMVAALLIHSGATGYISCIKNLAEPPEDWEIAGIPLAKMIHMEERKGKLKPVIKKALVDLAGNPFKIFREQRDQWAVLDDYRYPGPIQFSGPKEITESITLTLEYESKKQASIL